jgi:hypothetical protein
MAIKRCENFAEALSHIASNHGADVLLDDVRLTGYIADYLRGANIERAVLKNAFERGIPAKLAAARDQNEAERQAVMYGSVRLLVDNYGMAENVVEERLWVLAEALGWESKQKREEQERLEKERIKAEREARDKAEKARLEEEKRKREKEEQQDRERVRLKAEQKLQERKRHQAEQEAREKARQKAEQEQREKDRLKAEQERQNKAEQEAQEKVRLRAERYKNIKKGETIKFGSYDWRVLEVDGGRALLLTDENVSLRMGNSAIDVEISVYHSSKSGITWENCKLREKLNDTFYNEFGVEEKSRIIEVPVINNNNPWYGTKGGNDTRDKIFLLSVEEVVLYLGDSGDLQNRRGWLWNNWKKEDVQNTKGQGWISDKFNGSRSNFSYSGWWLRSPGDKPSTAAYVFGNYNFRDGMLNLQGDHVNERHGVRPALWITIGYVPQPPPPGPAPSGPRGVDIYNK